MAVAGFITTKNGKYYAVLNLKEETGKRKQKWFSTNLPLRGNKRSAEKFLQKFPQKLFIPYLVSENLYYQLLMRWQIGVIIIKTNFKMQ